MTNTTITALTAVTGLDGTEVIPLDQTDGLGNVGTFKATVNQVNFVPHITRLASYTVSTLPSASTNVQGLIYVSNGTANKRLAISDGTNWRFPDGAIVS